MVPSHCAPRSFGRHRGAAAVHAARRRTACRATRTRRCDRPRPSRQCEEGQRPAPLQVGRIDVSADEQRAVRAPAQGQRRASPFAARQPCALGRRGQRRGPCASRGASPTRRIEQAASRPSAISAPQADGDGRQLDGSRFKAADALDERGEFGIGRGLIAQEPAPEPVVFAIQQLVGKRRARARKPSRIRGPASVPAAGRAPACRAGNASAAA